MDPDETLRLLIEAAVAGDGQEFDQHAEALGRWLDTGGFTPDYPSRTGALIIIAASAWSPAGEGMRPARLVIRLRPEDRHDLYMVHMEIAKEDGTTYFHHGDYTGSLRDAVEAHEQRCQAEHIDQPYTPLITNDQEVSRG